MILVCWLVFSMRIECWIRWLPSLGAVLQCCVADIPEWCESLLVG